MKVVIIVILALPVAGVVALFVLGLLSHSGQARGLFEGKLAKCPVQPNCICTEFEDDAAHYVDPIVFSQSNTPEVLSRIKHSVQQMRGSIEAENDHYLAATFTSSIFKFTDDLEIRIDFDQGMIHLRSASRVGYRDRGVNKKRIERLKSEIAAL